MARLLLSILVTIIVIVAVHAEICEVLDVSYQDGKPGQGIQFKIAAVKDVIIHDLSLKFLSAGVSKVQLDYSLTGTLGSWQNIFFGDVNVPTADDIVKIPTDINKPISLSSQMIFRVNVSSGQEIALVPAAQDGARWSFTQFIQVKQGMPMLNGDWDGNVAMSFIGTVGYCAVTCPPVPESLKTMFVFYEDCSNKLVGEVCPFKCGAGYFGDYGEMECYSYQGDVKWVTPGASACAECTYVKDGKCSKCDDLRGTCVACPRGQQPTDYICTDCLPGMFSNSTEGGLCQPCPEGTFAAGLNSTVCQPCPAGKTSNAGNTACVECPAGTVSYGDGRGCQPCPLSRSGGGGALETCVTQDTCVHVKATSASECTACDNDNFVDAGACVTACSPPLVKSAPFSDIKASCIATCPAGYSSTGENSVCQKCPEGCAECSVSTLYCTKCDSTHWMVGETDTAYATCVTSCGSMVKSGPAGLASSRCLSECPEGTYGMADQPCQTPQGACFSFNSFTGGCTECTTGWALSGEPGDARTICVDICESAYLDKDPDELDAMCVKTCPAGFYPPATYNSTCVACDTSCETCNSKGCLTCDGTKMLSGPAGVAGTTCVSTCASGYRDMTPDHKTAECKATCPEGRSAAAFDNVCAGCDGTCGHVCSYWDTDTNTTVSYNYLGCNSCADNRWLTGAPNTAGTYCVSSCSVWKKSAAGNETDARCISECPAGKFARVDQVCTNCDASCASCDPTTGGCTTCAAGKWLSAAAGATDTVCVLTCGKKRKDGTTSTSKCVETCPPGTFAAENAVCTACDASCDGACNAVTGSCTACPIGEYYNYTTPGVAKCVSTCVAPRPYRTGASTEGAMCLATCPPFMYPVSEVCERCPGNCKTCDASGNCLTCNGVDRWLKLTLSTWTCELTCPNYKDGDASSDTAKCVDSCSAGTAHTGLNTVCRPTVTGVFPLSLTPDFGPTTGYTAFNVTLGFPSTVGTSYPLEVDCKFADLAPIRGTWVSQNIISCMSLPKPAGTYPVQLIASSGAYTFATTTLNFRVVEPVVLDYFTPTVGPVGTVIDAFGSGFEDVDTLACVFYERHEKTRIVLSADYVSPTHLRCTFSPSVTMDNKNGVDYMFFVTVNGQQHSNPGVNPLFRHQKTPQLTDLAPENGPTKGSKNAEDGTVVFGIDFVDSDTLSCRFNGMWETEPTFMVDLVIKCPIPPSTVAGPVNVDVSNNGQQWSNPVKFTYEQSGLNRFEFVQMPSKLTQNLAPLVNQPVLKIVDEFGDVIIGKNVDVYAWVQPLYKSLSGYFMPVDNTTGLVTFTNFTLEGFYNSNYYIEFTATGFESLTHCCIGVDTCAHILEGSVLTEEGTCECDRGYRYLDVDEICALCPEDTFKDETGQGDCTSCHDRDVHTYTDSKGKKSADDCICMNTFEPAPINDTLYAGLCVCPAGTELTAVTGLDDVCTPCGPHSTNRHHGLTVGACVCDPGYEITVSDGCQPCPAGSYKSNEGNKGCIPCGDNMKTIKPVNTNQTDCVCVDTFVMYSSSCVCDANYELKLYSPTNKTCIPCASHSENPYPGVRQDACMCSPGYNLDVELGECVQCVIGTYKTDIADVGCINCHEYMITNDTGRTNYTSCYCEPGFTLLDPFASYQDQQCMCVLGFEFVEGFEQCRPCPSDTYKDVLNRDSCTHCPDPFEVTNSTGSATLSDCVCKTGFERFVPPQNSDINSNATKPCGCPPGYQHDKDLNHCQECGINNYKEVTNLEPCTPCDATRAIDKKGSKSRMDCVCKFGYWAPDPKLDVPCEEAPFCSIAPGGRQMPYSAPGCYMVTEGMFNACPNPDACTGSNACSEGYEGFVCGECALGWYKTGVECKRCDRFGDFALYLAGVGLVIFVAVLYYVAFRPSNNSRFGSGRILLNYFQITALYAQFDLNWPPEIKMVWDIMRIFNLDIEVSRPECSLNQKISFYQIYMFKVSLPLILAATAMVIYGCCLGFRLLYIKYRKYQEVKHGLPEYQPDETDRYFLRYAVIRTCVVCLVVAYTPLCSTVLSFFDCTQQNDGSYTLDSHPGYRCYTHEYYLYMIAGLPALLIYLPGVPGLVAYILYKNKDRLTEDAYYAMFGFMHARFELKYYYWEAVLLTRSLGIVSALVLLNTHVPVQTMCATTVLMAALYMHSTRKPFMAAHLNKLETFSLFSSQITLLAGSVFNAELQAGSINTGLTILVILLLALNVLFMIVALMWEIRPPEKDVMHIAEGESSGDFKLAKEYDSTVGFATQDANAGNNAPVEFYDIGSGGHKSEEDAGWGGKRSSQGRGNDLDWGAQAPLAGGAFGGAGGFGGDDDAPMDFVME